MGEWGHFNDDVVIKIHPFIRKAKGVGEKGLPVKIRERERESAGCERGI